MGLKVTNNAFGTLNASINSSATTIVLVAGQGARFPTLSAGDYFYATLIDTSNNLEIVKCTARSTDTLTVVRGQDSTTARAYATNDRFELRPTAALFNEKANDNEVVHLTGTETISGTKTFTGRTLINVASDKQLEISGPEAEIWLSSTGTSKAWRLLGSTGGSTHLFRIYDNTAGANRLDINDSGIVRLPKIPCFFGQRIGGSYTTSGSIIVWDNVQVNNGSHYNSSNGRFTAPVDGFYRVHSHYIQSSGGDFFIRKNGTRITSGHQNHDDPWDNSNVQAIFQCNAGDYIDFELANMSGGTWFGASSPSTTQAYNGCSIYLIG